MRTLLLRITVCGFAIGLAGCVVPLPEDIDVHEASPFKSVKPAIKPGSTTKVDVLSRILGRPQQSFYDGALFIYTAEAETGMRFMLFPFTRPGKSQVETRYMIAVRFDNQGVARTFEAYEEGGGYNCLSSGECVVQYHQKFGRPLVVLARPNEDENAKRLESHPTKCSVYVFAEIHSSHFQVVLAKSSIFSWTEGYLQYHLEPGRYDIQIKGLDSWPIQFDKRQLSFDCRPQETIFLKYYDPWFGKIKIDVVGIQEGQEGLSERKLVLKDDNAEKRYEKMAPDMERTKRIERHWHALIEAEKLKGPFDNCKWRFNSHSEHYDSAVQDCETRRDKIKGFQEKMPRGIAGP